MAHWACESPIQLQIVSHDPFAIVNWHDRCRGALHAMNHVVMPSILSLSMRFLMSPACMQEQFRAAHLPNQSMGSRLGAHCCHCCLRLNIIACTATHQQLLGLCAQEAILSKLIACLRALQCRAYVADLAALHTCGASDELENSMSIS